MSKSCFIEHFEKVLGHCQLSPQHDSGHWLNRCNLFNCYCTRGVFQPHFRTWVSGLAGFLLIRSSQSRYWLKHKQIAGTGFSLLMLFSSCALFYVLAALPSIFFQLLSFLQKKKKKCSARFYCRIIAKCQKAFCKSSDIISEISSTFKSLCFCKASFHLLLIMCLLASETLFFFVTFISYTVFPTAHCESFYWSPLESVIVPIGYVVFVSLVMIDFLRGFSAIMNNRVRTRNVLSLFWTIVILIEKEYCLALR